MDDRCSKCFSRLDENGNCPVCTLEPEAGSKDIKIDSEIKHVEGETVKDGSGDLDIKGIPRTHPVKVDMDKIKSTMEDGQQEDDLDIELNPDDIEIDFNKIDTSTLFDEDFEEEEVRVKMLPQRLTPKDRKRIEREYKEKPSEAALRRREVYAIPDLEDGEVETSKGVAIRTKGSMVKKKGSSLVLLIALAIIFIIIIALYLAGFLRFAI